MKTLKAIDICCGGGGWAVAARGLPIEIVAAFDSQEDCLLTYKHNHPSTRMFQRDVAGCDFSEFSGIDLILGGIPCEQISVARCHVPLRRNVLARWKRLLNRMLSLPGELGAPYWIYEDVVGVLRHCDVPHIILDSQYFSPQRRKRAFLGTVPNELPSTCSLQFKDVVRRGPYRLNPRTTARRPSKSEAYNSDHFYPWQYDAKSPTVITLDSRNDGKAAVQHGDLRRQLEWQELATLQGFPDDYLFLGTPGRTVKMIGQAVQIDTARALLGWLCAIEL